MTNETIGSLALANYYLRSLGHETRIVRGDRPINPRTKTIFITGGNLQHEEAYLLAAWVEAGGRLIWHGPNPLQWGGAYELLLGAELIDLRTPQDTLLKLAGQEWKIRSFPGDTRLEVNPTQAVVAAVDDSGFPLILRHMLGRGMVTCVLANVEKSILDSAHTRAERDRWRKWYHALLRD